MLGEAATTEIARNTDAKGFDQNKTAAKKGGKVAEMRGKTLKNRVVRKSQQRTISNIWMVSLN